MSMKPDDHRRKWDRDEYEKLAEDRKIEERNKEDDKKNKKNAPPIKREPLKRREHKIDLESNIGKSVLINNTLTTESGGFYCKDCDCIIKDSISYLDHVNGRTHQKNLGMSMRIERSSLESVRARFEKNKQKIEEKKQEYDMSNRLKEIAEEEEKMKAYRRNVRKNKRKAKHAESETEEDDEMAQLMGFGGFGSKKKH